jgi:hypothetical protein
VADLVSRAVERRSTASCCCLIWLAVAVAAAVAAAAAGGSPGRPHGRFETENNIGEGVQACSAADCWDVIGLFVCLCKARAGPVVPVREMYRLNDCLDAKGQPAAAA